MISPGTLPGAGLRRVTRRSRLLFDWRADDLSLTARTGQVGTLTRASSGGARLMKGGASGAVRLAKGAPANRASWEMVWNPVTGLYEPALRLEGSRTNLLSRSQELGAATWSKSNATVTGDADTAPDGTLTADRIVEDSTASTFHLVTQSVTATANATYAVPIYFKAAGRSWFHIEVREAGAIANRLRVWFNAATGVVGTADNGGTATGATGRIEAVGNGWYRCTLTGAVNNGATSIAVQVWLADADGSTTYSGDGASYISIWGAQFEDSAAFSSSYIATTSATVTRAADSLAFPYVAPPQEMTVYLRFVERGSALASATQGGIFHIGAAVATNDPRLFIIGAIAGGYVAVYDDGTTFANTLPLAIPPIGSLVELRLTLVDNGDDTTTITLYQSINGAAETSVSATGGPLLPAWAGQLLYLNSQGTTNPGNASHQFSLVAPGVHTLDAMRAA